MSGCSNKFRNKFMKAMLKSEFCSPDPIKPEKLIMYHQKSFAQDIRERYRKAERPINYACNPCCVKKDDCPPRADCIYKPIKLHTEPYQRHWCECCKPPTPEPPPCEEFPPPGPRRPRVCWEPRGTCDD